MEFLPDLFTFEDGSRVKCTGCWMRRREELIEILSREEFGRMPAHPGTVRGEVTREVEKCCSGHAVLQHLRIAFDTPSGEFSFPMFMFRPVKEEKVPLILLINFRPDVYDMYYPAEEIIDHGFALGVIYYEDITKDNGDMQDGLAALYPRRNDGTDWGKIGMWAFSMSCAMDYLETLPWVDTENVAYAGHSRLGKTALWAGALDPRAKFVISNSAGCAGDAYERVKHEGGETVADITKTFPFWFCENYRSYAGNAEAMPFDQHFLLSLTAPRYLLIGSASEDLWADPVSQELSCRAVTPVWELYGLPGYVGGEGPASIGDRNSEGCVGYHLRHGVHFFGRPDWLAYLEFMEKKICRR